MKGGMVSVSTSGRAIALLATICIVAFCLCCSPGGASPTENSVTYNINLGDECLEKGDYNGAIGYYEKACGIFPDMVLPHVLIGEVWYQKGDYSTANGKADYALELEKDNSDALILKAKCLEAQEYTQDALNIFDRVYRREPDNNEAVLGRARTFATQFGPEQGILFLLDVSDERGGLSSPAILDYLGDLYRDAGETDKAKSAYVLVLQRDPDFGTTQQKLKVLAAQPAAIETATKSTAKVTPATNPTYAREWFDSGMYLMKRRIYDEAIKSFEKAYENDPTLVEEVFLNIGHAYLKRGDYEQARSYLLLALNENPQNALAWNNLGVLAEKTGSVDNARNCYQMALSLDPDFSSPQYNQLLMEGKEQLLTGTGIIILILLLVLLLIVGWKKSISKKSQNPVIFCLIGAIAGAFLGGLMAIHLSSSDPIIGFYNIALGCSILGIYAGRRYLRTLQRTPESDDVQYQDMKFYRYHPYLTPVLIFSVLYGGFINTFFSVSEGFSTINGMLAGLLICYFSFDFALRSGIKEKEENALFRQSSLTLYILTTGIYAITTLEPIRSITDSTSILGLTDLGILTYALFGVAFGLNCLYFLGVIYEDKGLTLRRIKYIIFYYLLFLIPGWIYYEILIPYEVTGNSIAEMLLFFIPLGMIAGHFLFTPFDKKAGSLNKISLNEERAEAEQKEKILKKIERTTGMDLSGNETQGEKR